MREGRSKRLEKEKGRLPAERERGGGVAPILAVLSLCPGEEVVTGWANPTQSDRHWRSTIIMACHSSPHLAFQIMNRLVIPLKG